VSTAVQRIPSQPFPSDSQLAVAYSVCRGITKSAAKNFYYAFLVLPAAKRQALYAVYAFMRRCDDIADDTSLTAHERRLKLGAWVDAFHQSQAGKPTDDPVQLALADAVRRFQIPPVLLDQLAYGTAMDIEQRGPEGAHAPSAVSAAIHSAADKMSPPPLVQYKTFDDLYLYCYRVASVVGLVCIRIFGYREPGAEALAERCGLAFQLTNIIRDVKEDAAMDRVYIPQEDLTRFDIAPSELRAGKDLDRIRPLLAREADRAREFYRSADELIPLINEDSQPALWVLVTIYRRLLEKIALRGFDVFKEKIQLTTREKLVILGKGFLKRLA
jgi:15-cis-phytoene synthase